ncbi:MAG TPA: hypothetical protein VG605_18385 [Puia sp.]|nr:hypothetical protein [Puia sp.]
MLRKIILYSMFLGVSHGAALVAFAQQGDSVDMRTFLTKIQRAYSKGHFLDFNMQYYYANADHPQVYLDSLYGRIQMDKGNYRMTLAGVETIITDRYAIQINNTDKSIYLAAARKVAAANPVGMVDSILAHIQGVQMAVTKGRGEEALTLDFPPDQAYSHITIRIDAKTGLLRRISYALNTARLVGQEMINRPGNPSPYTSRGNMEIVFSDYREGKFDESLFREDNFVTRVSPGHFEPAARYKDYHIYLASSNL